MTLFWYLKLSICKNQRLFHPPNHEDQLANGLMPNLLSHDHSLFQLSRMLISRLTKMIVVLSVVTSIISLVLPSAGALRNSLSWQHLLPKQNIFRSQMLLENRFISANCCMTLDLILRSSHPPLCMETT